MEGERPRKKSEGYRCDKQKKEGKKRALSRSVLVPHAVLQSSHRANPVIYQYLVGTFEFITGTRFPSEMWLA